MGIVILSMTMGSFTNIMGQDAIRFTETYKSNEVIGLLDKEDAFFSMMNTENVDPEASRLGICPDSESDAIWKHLHSKEVRKRLPKDLRFAWGWESEAGNRTLFALRDSQKAGPEQEDLKSVSIQESKREGNYDLLLTFSKQGADSWARMTRENVGRNIAIVLDGKVLAAPLVRMEIRQGKCQISGNFSKAEAMEIKTLIEN